MAKKCILGVVSEDLEEFSVSKDVFSVGLSSSSFPWEETGNDDTVVSFSLRMDSTLSSGVKIYIKRPDDFWSVDFWSFLLVEVFTGFVTSMF